MVWKSSIFDTKRLNKSSTIKAFTKRETKTKTRHSMRIVVFLLIAVLLICNTSQAQEIIHHHELKIAIGSGWFYELGSYADETSFCYESKDTPSYNLSYNYKTTNRITLGGTLTYARNRSKNYVLETQTISSETNTHITMVGLTPSVKFDWLQKKIIRLYSSTGIGIGYIMERETDITTNHSINKSSVVPLIDFTCIGVSVGGKIFGSMELGLSSSGIIRIGIGYRFSK